jgi:hypothetical protein
MLAWYLLTLAPFFFFFFFFASQRVFIVTKPQGTKQKDTTLVPAP